MIRHLVIASVALLPTGIAAQAARAEYDQLVAAFHAEHPEAHATAAKVPPLLPAESPIHAKFLAAAKRYEGNDDALPFLGWILQNAVRNEAVYGAAVAQVEKLADMVEVDPGAEKKLYDASRNAVRKLKYETVDDATFATTLRDAKVLAAKAPTESIRAASARSVFKLENLRPGMIAPDIVGGDLDGVEFKLSDYRGKVVVIDFWGDW